MLRTSEVSFYLTKSRVRSDLLTLFFLHPERSYYLRELQRQLQTSPGTLARELKFFWSEGLLERESRGREIFYQINSRHPLFKEIKGIVEKTAGVPNRLSAAFKGMKEISEAYLYGSYVTGKMRAHSDIDLLLVGRETDSLRKLLNRLETRFGRRMNATTYSPKEFKRKQGDRSEFVFAIMKSPFLKLKP